jgi:hypothetical protein
LFGGNARSPAELKTERVLDRLEGQLAMQEQAKDRGEVYLDVNDLRELRAAGTIMSIASVSLIVWDWGG